MLDDICPNMEAGVKSCDCNYCCTHRKKSKKKSGVSSSRAHRIQNTLMLRLKDIFSHTIHFKLTHNDMCDRILKDVIDSPEAKKAPKYVNAYIQGVWDTMRENLYKNHIVWLLSCDGMLMTHKEVNELTKKEVSDMYRAFAAMCEESVQEYKKHGGSCRHPPTEEEFERKFIPSDYRSPWARINGDLSRHVWKDAQGSPLRDKPFDRRFIVG